jgi:tetratricopeptide (TPR) repeat protein
MNFAENIENITKYIERNPQDYRGYCGRGRLLAAQRRYSEYAVSLNSTDKKTYYHLGKLYTERGEFRKAIDYLYKSISFDSCYHEAIFELGCCFVVLGESQKAIEYMEKAYRLNPRKEYADIINQGKEYQEIKQLRESFEKYMPELTSPPPE